MYYFSVLAFFRLRFKQLSVTVFMMSLDVSSIAILNIHGIDYRCIIVGITKSEAIKLLRNADICEKGRSL